MCNNNYGQGYTTNRIELTLKHTIRSGHNRTSSAHRRRWTDLDPFVVFLILRESLQRRAGLHKCLQVSFLKKVSRKRRGEGCEVAFWLIKAPPSPDKRIKSIKYIYRMHPTSMSALWQSLESSLNLFCSPAFRCSDVAYVPAGISMNSGATEKGCLVRRKDIHTPLIQES